MPAWLADEMDQLRRSCKGGLADIMCKLLSYAGPDLSRSQALIETELERGMLSHCSGMLLPDCCYVGCTNLDGVSEAAMVTQLCSR